MTTLEDVFGAGGIFARSFAGYEERPQQVQLAAAAAAAFRDGEVLLGEAPCGVGKSVALLVPALLEMQAKGGKLVYVTANIALQEQILKKDLPQLREILPFPFTFEIAKGFGNYVCQDRMDETESEISVGQHRNNPDLELLRELLAFTWDRGDLSEFPRELPAAARRLVTIPSDECLGKRCPSFETCHPRAARKRFGNADVVVTNYAMYFIDLAVKASGGKGILPQHRMLVADECFPAGTKVGSVAIETIRVGDVVPSYDERTGDFVRRRVTRLFVSKPSSLLRVRCGGREIACTPGHPFLTQRGWVPALDLNVDDIVLSFTNGLQTSTKSCEVEGRSLPRLQEEAGGFFPRTPAEQGGEVFLFEGLFEGVHARRTSREDGAGRGPEGLLGEDVGKEPHELARSFGNGFEAVEGDWAQTSSTGRQWRGSHGCSVDASRGVGQWLEAGGFGGDRQACEGFSDALYDRHRSFEVEDCRRSRWTFSQGASSQNLGRSEGQVSDWCRVESVEVLEPGSDGTFGGVCPDGLVYNLEVSGTHTYLVEGLVVHNCHNMADLSRKHFGQRVTYGGLKTLLHELRATGRRAEKLELPKDIDPALRERAEREAERYFAELDRVRRSDEYRARFDRLRMVDGTVLEGLLKEAGDKYLAAGASPGLPSEAREFLRGRADSLYLKAGVVHHARALDREGWIAFVEGEPGKRLELASEPIDAGPFLRQHLFAGRKGGTGPQGIVLASATLTVPEKDGRGNVVESFDYSATRLGLACDSPANEVEGVAEVVVGSPFDFSRAALVVPRGLPDPQDALFAGEVAETLVRLCEATGGAVLGLYTSYRVMEKGAAALRRARPDLIVLVQGEMPRTELVRRFRADRSSVLLGTDSLWEGVDVQGESCVAVLIDRLPFDHMDDPVLDAIKQADKNWFKKTYLPKAVLAFKQGFGRLIRTLDDYGVVVCCDKRITTKGYGSKFRRALPEGTGFYENLSEVPELLERFRRSSKVA